MLGTFVVLVEGLVVEGLGVSGEVVKRGRKFSEVEAYISKHRRKDRNHLIRNSSEELAPSWGGGGGGEQLTGE